MVTADLNAGLDRNARDLRSVVTCLAAQAAVEHWDDVNRLAEGLVRLVSERRALETLRQAALAGPPFVAPPAA